MNFYLYQPVYFYNKDSTSFPETHEKYGHLLGVLENVGDALTYVVYTEDN